MKFDMLLTLIEYTLKIVDIKDHKLFVNKNTGHYAVKVGQNS